MNHSIFIARLLGLYSVILSVWCFLNIKHLHSFLITIANTPSTLLMLGIFTLLLGLAIMISHQVFRGWPIIVTILGYWITLKGLVLLFAPHLINQVIVFWQGKNMLYAPLPSLIIGLILLFCGFFLKKST